MTTIASWISALAAVGALVAAVWAGLSARRLYEIESGRDRRAEESRESAAARLVTAWTAVHLPDGRDGERRSGGLVIANASEAPIFDIEVRSEDHSGRAQPPLWLTLLPPGEYFSEHDPKFHWSFPDPVAAFDGLIRPISKQDRWRVSLLTFTDAAGVAWQRDDSGLSRRG